MLVHFIWWLFQVYKNIENQNNWIILKDEGNIYAWGLGSFGQLGTDEVLHRQATPKKISLKIIENVTPEFDKLNLALHPHNVRKLIGSIKMVLSFDASFIFMSFRLIYHKYELFIRCSWKLWYFGKFNRAWELWHEKFSSIWIYFKSRCSWFRKARSKSKYYLFSKVGKERVLLLVIFYI